MTVILPETPRFLVFRNEKIGNTLAAVPVLRALRERWPKAVIDVVVDKVAGETLANCPYTNELILFEKRRQGAFRFNHWKLVQRLRRSHYDAAILCKRFRRNEILAWLSGTPVRIGFETPNKSTPFKLTHKVIYDDLRRVVDNNLNLLGPLGLASDSHEFEFWWTKGEESALFETADAQGFDLNGKFIMFHITAEGHMEHILPAELFAAVAQRLREEKNHRSIFVFGPNDQDKLDEMHSAMQGKGLFLARQSLGTKAVAMSRAQLFVGHDSGPSHLAAAVGLPGVIIYTSPNWRRFVRKWKPEGDQYAALDGSQVDEAMLYRTIVERLDTTPVADPKPP